MLANLVQEQNKTSQTRQKRKIGTKDKKKADRSLYTRYDVRTTWYMRGLAAAADARTGSAHSRNYSSIVKS